MPPTAPVFINGGGSSTGTCIYYCGLRHVLNVCCDYAGQDKIDFDCNKTFGVVFRPKMNKQPVTPIVSLDCSE